MARVRKIPGGKASSERKMSSGHTLRFYSGRHTYWVRGGEFSDWTWLRSCTQATDYADGKPDELMAWQRKVILEAMTSLLQPGVVLTPLRVQRAVNTAGRQPDAIRDAAAEHGIKAHEILNTMAKGKEPAATAVSLPLMRWWNEWQVEVIGSEMLVADVDAMVAGHVDLLCLVTDPVTHERFVAVIDLKTSNYVLRKHWAQLGGYQRMLRKEGIAFDKGLILHLPYGATNVVTHIQTDIEDDIRAFGASLFLAWWHEDKKRKQK